MASRTRFARRLPLALALAAMLVVASAETPIAAVKTGGELTDKNENEKLQAALLNSNDQRHLDQAEEPQGGDGEDKKTEEGDTGDAVQNEGDNTEKKPEGEEGETPGAGDGGEPRNGSRAARHQCHHQTLPAALHYCGVLH